LCMISTGKKSDGDKQENNKNSCKQRG